MSHTIRSKDKLVARVRRLKGQVEAVERALEAEAGCGQVLQLLASIRGALNGLNGELLEQHLHEHVLHARDEAERQAAAEELAAILKTYMR
ncbi:transcriptional regulator [Rhizobium rhizosphaerae]|uniref:Transcriptional regulator n=1 Tax=Xaviernesmea rhizosphaerae TaxID=1672749 RepID=A0A1Q9ANQ4_9HYPH|nr:Ni(II)/Co(II)-sensing transcriptional repressor DmeR [Xaviernesmea rhizosphaerae]OLP57050.1 transcriptional regulator [Xaviernesmea rhizosphaerae]OQP87105.1 transcriptional regulator [Xaviernesmea rhizosphaerae]